ncbi:hypothetical protein BS78_06G291300 [Paspalum vaginatum]|nr:hypothetical protein BS78_06G291300 [Paspalum vaginatum]
MVLDAARSVVTVIEHFGRGEDHHLEFTGFVVGLESDHIANQTTRKRITVLTCYNDFTSQSDPNPKLQVLLPNGSVFEAKLLFFNAHYDVALLEILAESSDDLPLQLPSFGSNPNYGQEVLVLGRDDHS